MAYYKKAIQLSQQSANIKSALYAGTPNAIIFKIEYWLPNPLIIERLKVMRTDNPKEQALLFYMQACYYYEQALSVDQSAYIQYEKASDSLLKHMEV